MRRQMSLAPNFLFFSRKGIGSREDTREKGFALIFVLWILLLLNVLGGSLLKEARSARISAAATKTNLHNRLIADGAINRAILSLLDPTDPLRLPLDGASRTITAFEETVTLRVRSENGKIDLNAAPSGLLETMFQSQGIDPGDARGLATRIAEWRASQSDQDREAINAEYAAAGRCYGPRFAAFKSIAELRLLLGVSTALQDAVKPNLTIWSMSASVDRAVSSDETLRLMAAAGDKIAESQVRARQIGQAAGADRRPVAGEVLEIRATVHTVDGEARRTAFVQITYDPAKPFRVFKWQ